MDIDAVKDTLQKELGEVKENKDEISKKLIEPSREHFTTMDGVEREHWVIGKKDEYFIVFNENKMSFGLAFRNVANEMVYLGDEGSLADAYETLISREEPTAKEPPRSGRSFSKKRRR